MAETETLGQKLRKLQASIKPTFQKASEAKTPADKEKAETELLELRKKIVNLKKLSFELQSAFDAAVDFRDEGMFGVDFAPEVTRIRTKTDKVGRPKKEKKDELAELDI